MNKKFYKEGKIESKICETYFFYEFITLWMDTYFPFIHIQDFSAAFSSLNNERKYERKVIKDTILEFKISGQN